MMPSEQIRSAVRVLVKQLVAGEYDALVAGVKESRLSSEDMRQCVEQYGRTLVLPLDLACSELDIVEGVDADTPTWSVRMPLWTREEGKSDLVLELTTYLGNSGTEIELDDLHVL